MAFVILETKDLAELRERLKNNKLAPDDIKFLDLLLTRAQTIAEIQSRSGRLTIDALPIGMDLVK